MILAFSFATTVSSSCLWLVPQLQDKQYSHSVCVPSRGDGLPIASERVL